MRQLIALQRNQKIRKNCSGCGNSNLKKMEVFDYGRSYFIFCCEDCGTMFN